MQSYSFPSLVDTRTLAYIKFSSICAVKTLFMNLSPPKGAGGAIFLGGSTIKSVSIDESTFYNCTSTSYGGAIYSFGKKNSFKVLKSCGVFCKSKDGFFTNQYCGQHISDLQFDECAFVSCRRIQINEYGYGTIHCYRVDLSAKYMNMSNIFGFTASSLAIVQCYTVNFQFSSLCNNTGENRGIVLFQYCSGSLFFVNFLNNCINSSLIECTGFGLKSCIFLGNLATMMFSEISQCTMIDCYSDTNLNNSKIIVSGGNMSTSASPHVFAELEKEYCNSTLETCYVLNRVNNISVYVSVGYKCITVYDSLFSEISSSDVNGGAIFSELNELLMNVRMTTFFMCDAMIQGGAICVHANNGNFSTTGTCVLQCAAQDGSGLYIRFSKIGDIYLNQTNLYMCPSYVDFSSKSHITGSVSNCFFFMINSSNHYSLSLGTSGIHMNSQNIYFEQCLFANSKYLSQFYFRIDRSYVSWNQINVVNNTIISPITMLIRLINCYGNHDYDSVFLVQNHIEVFIFSEQSLSVSLINCYSDSECIFRNVIQNGTILNATNTLHLVFYQSCFATPKPSIVKEKINWVLPTVISALLLIIISISFVAFKLYKSKERLEGEQQLTKTIFTDFG